MLKRAAGNHTLLCSLPDDLLVLVYNQLGGVELARLVCLTRRHAPLVLHSAEQQLRRLDPAWPSPRGWPLALASFEALASAVGRRPELHDWVAEWPALAQIRSRPPPSQVIKIENLLCKSAMAAELRHGLDWPLDHAHAVALLTTFFRRDLGRMLLRDDESAAPGCAWMMRDALLGAARRQSARGVPVPRCYAVLAGPVSSLGAQDRSWHALSRFDEAGQAGALSPGAQFRTHACAVAWAAADKCPGGCGPELTRVCFESAPPTRSGYRGLIELGSGQFALPPLAWVRVERVEGRDGDTPRTVHVRVCYA